MPREDLPQQPPGKGAASHPGHRLAHDGFATASPDRPQSAAPASGQPQTAALSSGRPRIIALDVLRGFALCGIVLSSVPSIAAVGDALKATTGSSDGDWFGLLVHQRFFPIFSTLFGIGFTLLLNSARRRVPRPRLLLLRRLLVLLAIGLAHMFLLWPGDILTTYAVVGLLVLLPSTWLPRWAVAGLAAVLIVTPLVLGHSGPSLAPGLFLLGSTLARYGLIDRIERSTLVPAGLGLAFAAGAVPAVWLQVDSEAAGAGRSTSWFAPAGLLMAGLYVCTLLVLLRTPLRPALQAVFAPLGRMTLTNYLTATVLVLVTAHVIGGSPDTWSSTTVLLIAGPVLAVQWLWSALWLRRFRQGPIEWLWRWATWGRRPPLRAPLGSASPASK
ncbi:putative membrane protein YeiB [Nonomuraea polychroma]|uniref:Putative membrane protein YeiB n=1 Tax=Nonomuraea polychroma TaxID=46176 RepID=A0A438LWK7_9ACTN|nr:DUF418 domain-containing protein [Nonomuraea polychroma]RVX37890.1 putative membrane protein YeiB [Nonomuraea polychroma]